MSQPNLTDLAAHLLGVSAKTLRHYQRLGLLSDSHRLLRSAGRRAGSDAGSVWARTNTHRCSRAIQYSLRKIFSAS